MPRKSRQSAGILVYRRRAGGVEVLLVHPGGPFWAGKDLGAWSIPKGEFGEGEDALEAARREFREETGAGIDGEFVALKPVRQPSGKTVHGWAVEGDCDVQAIRSNTFSMEWPPHSGALREFPEVDRAGWFAPGEARARIHPGQAAILEELLARLDDR